MRALKARCTRTPLQMAVRGRFLVGSRPLSDDLVRRFILCAAESGIDIFRLHDPLNDVENLTSAAAAVREAGGRLYAGLAFSGYMPNLPRVVDKASRLAELGADHVLLHDPAGALDPGTCDRVVAQLAEASGSPGRASTARARAERAGDGDRGRPATAPSRSRSPPTRWPTRCTASRPRCCATRCPASASSTGVDTDRRVGRLAVHRRARHLADAGVPIPPRITLRTALQPAAGGARRRPRRPAAGDGRTRPAGRGAGGVEGGADGLRHAAAGPADRRDHRRPGASATCCRPGAGRRCRTR